MLGNGNLFHGSPMAVYQIQSAAVRFVKQFFEDFLKLYGRPRPVQKTMINYVAYPLLRISRTSNKSGVDCGVL